MKYSIPVSVVTSLRQVFNTDGRMVVLTGAGISAESGIPTFRGRNGFWTVGSSEYMPQAMATWAMFEKHPADVWAWYLYRIGLYRDAEPNAGHYALVELERILGERFQLVTQNVDGLHIRAGSSADRIFQIHGNIRYLRCARECTREIRNLPEELIVKREHGSGLMNGEEDFLRCPKCGGWARPHILWMDEYYDEEYYRYESAIRAAESASVLLVVGTTGTTNLPIQMGQCAARAGARIIDINIEENPFSELAQSVSGAFIRGPSATILPEMVEALRSV